MKYKFLPVADIMIQPLSKSCFAVFNSVSGETHVVPSNVLSITKLLLGKFLSTQEINAIRNTNTDLSALDDDDFMNILNQLGVIDYFAS